MRWKQSYGISEREILKILLLQRKSQEKAGEAK